jgi:serine protease Do
MANLRLRPRWQSALALAPLLTALWCLTARADDVRVNKSPAPDMQLPAAFAKPVPETVEDLKQIQAHVKTLIDKVMPAVVNIKAGPAQGSGIVVTEDGFVLTAGHVSRNPGNPCTVTFSDGTEVKAKTLGWNKMLDCGMIKIVKEGKYPFCDMGKSGNLKKGDWCLAIGHPGGWKEGRTPPVRVGRIINPGGVLIQTDCTLVGGDSGGPLFDMQGRVIAIHSQIDQKIDKNLHVPVDLYREAWERLAEGEYWNDKTTTRVAKEKEKERTPQARLGMTADASLPMCKVYEVRPDSPAEKCGLKKNDIITEVDGQKIGNYDDLLALLERHKPGDTIHIVVRRGEETLTLEAVLGKALSN